MERLHERGVPTYYIFEKKKNIEDILLKIYQPIEDDNILCMQKDGFIFYIIIFVFKDEENK